MNPGVAYSIMLSDGPVSKSIKSCSEHKVRSVKMCDDAEEAPPDYRCPIGKTVMSKPVILIETSITYDQHNVDRWFR